MSEWVDVDERLPDFQYGYVLVHCSGGNIDKTFFCKDREYLRNSGNAYSRKVQGKNSGNFELAYKYGYKITHWMLLPEKPTTEINYEQ